MQASKFLPVVLSFYSPCSEVYKDHFEHFRSNSFKSSVLFFLKFLEKADQKRLLEKSAKFNFVLQT